MRYGENKTQNKVGMFIANYAVCAVLSRIFMGQKPFFSHADGWVTVALFGAISGILYLASFVLLQKNISKNGLSTSAVFMKLGVLVPTVMAIDFGCSCIVEYLTGLLVQIGSLFLLSVL